MLLAQVATGSAILGPPATVPARFAVRGEARPAVARMTANDRQRRCWSVSRWTPLVAAKTATAELPAVREPTTSRDPDKMGAFFR